MAYAWFVCGYVIIDGKSGPNSARYCAMDDFTAQIAADGGAWSETEVLGGQAVVKVRASEATLTTIAGTSGFYRIPNHWVLSDLLTDLTTARRTAITNRILAMGYTQAEIDAVMGNTLALWRQKTLSTLLVFIAGRRKKPRYDHATHTIILDGIQQDCKPIHRVNDEVP